MGRLTFKSHSGPSVWAIILSGFGTGCIFVPLSAVAFANLPNEQVGNASGLYNLFRNIGGSVGISIVNTIVARHSQLHQNELVRSLVLQQCNAAKPTALLQQYLQSQGFGPVDAMQKAYGIIGRQLQAQATLWSYVDDFRYMAFVCFACIPVVFLLKKAAARKGAVAAD